MTNMTAVNVESKQTIPYLRRKLAAGMTKEQAQREYEERRAEGLSHDEIERLDHKEWSRHQAQRERAEASIAYETAESNRFLMARFMYTAPEQIAASDAACAAHDALSNAQRNVQRAIWAAERVGITDETDEVRAARAAARAADDAYKLAREAWVVACMTEEEQAAYRATEVAQAAAQQCHQCKQFFRSSQDWDSEDSKAHRILKRDRWGRWDHCLLPHELMERGWRFIHSVWHPPQKPVLTVIKGGRAS